MADGMSSVGYQLGRGLLVYADYYVMKFLFRMILLSHCFSSSFCYVCNLQFYNYVMHGLGFNQDWWCGGRGAQCFEWECGQVCLALYTGVWRHASHVHLIPFL